MSPTIQGPLGTAVLEYRGETPRVARPPWCIGGFCIWRDINDGQRASWPKSIGAFDEYHQEQGRLPLFPWDREIPDHAREFGVQGRLSQFRLHRPRQWGGCWAFCRLWEQLQLDEFWRGRLLDAREGALWYLVLMVVTAYQLLGPGSDWRLHRQWYGRSVMADLLDKDCVVIANDTLYRCLDRIGEMITDRTTTLANPRMVATLKRSG